MIDTTCSGCRFLLSLHRDGTNLICNYLEEMGRRRPCPSGNGCTEYEEALPGDRLIVREEEPPPEKENRPQGRPRIYDTPEKIEEQERRKREKRAEKRRAAKNVEEEKAEWPKAKWPGSDGSH